MDISDETTETDAGSCAAVDFYNPGTARPTAREVTLLSLIDAALTRHRPERAPDEVMMAATNREIASASQ
eukprot:scaffold20002_cov129-Isochrysis_galbana.AAC.1